MQRSPAATFAATFLQIAFLFILTSAVLTPVLAENLKTFKNSSQLIEMTNLPLKGKGQNHGGFERALAMTYRTPPALEAASLPPGVQLIPSSAPAVHPHSNMQGGEKIRASKLMTTEENQNDDNNNDHDNNDVSASTADVEPSSSLTTTTTTKTTTTMTTMTANDCSQEVKEEIGTSPATFMATSPTTRAAYHCLFSSSIHIFPSSASSDNLMGKDKGRIFFCKVELRTSNFDFDQKAKDI